MLQRTFVAVPTAIAVVSLVVGCAGPTASPASGPAVSALAPSAELAGTWAGTFGLVGDWGDADDAKCVVQIAGDDTFTGACEPIPEANNIARAGTWSGHVVTRRNRVTFLTSQGPRLTLVRSGNTLYGIGKDPATERTVMFKFEREVSEQ
jgi:hypothetical protein